MMQVDLQFQDQGGVQSCIAKRHEVNISNEVSACSATSLVLQAYSLSHALNMLARGASLPNYTTPACCQSDQSKALSTISFAAFIALEPSVGASLHTLHLCAEATLNTKVRTFSVDKLFMHVKEHSPHRMVWPL